jgi:hypothetical protein
MIADPEHPPPTTGAGKQQRANRGPGKLCSRLFDGQAQVLVGPTASRTWNCTVVPTSTTWPISIAPVEGSAPSSPRIMNSP